MKLLKKMEGNENLESLNEISSIELCLKNSNNILKSLNTNIKNTFRFIIYSKKIIKNEELIKNLIKKNMDVEIENDIHFVNLIVSNLPKNSDFEVSIWAFENNISIDDYKFEISMNNELKYSTREFSFLYDLFIQIQFFNFEIDFKKVLVDYFNDINEKEVSFVRIISNQYWILYFKELFENNFNSFFVSSFLVENENFLILEFE
jgi:hypothetical protein